MTMAQLRERQRDDDQVTQLCCPYCGLWADVDDDQLHGRVSVICPQCGYHETHDFAAGEG